MRGADFQRIAAVAAIAILPYLNALGAGFVFDDEIVVQNNPILQSTEPPLVEVVTKPYPPPPLPPLYRPLTLLTYWANRRFGSDTAFGFHAVNIVLHSGVSVLLYCFALQRGLPRAAAFLAAGIFAAHPIHTEAVTGIVGRAELLAALCVLGSLLCMQAPPGQRARPARVVSGTALFVLGLLSKESAFVLLPLLVLLPLSQRHGGHTPGTRSPIGAESAREVARFCASSRFLPFAAVALLYLGVRVALFGQIALPDVPGWMDNPLAHVPAAARVATASVVLADYIGLLLLPLRLSADYSFNQVALVTHAADPRLLGAVLLFLCSALLLWRIRRSVPIAPTAAIFFAVSLSTTANVFFPIGTIKAERLLYLPSVGFCLLAGGALYGGLRRQPALATLACVALIGGFAGRTWVRNYDWHSNGTLFRAAVRAAPNSAKAHHNLGVALEKAGQYEEASLSFRRALDLYPDYAGAAFGVGLAYQRRGMTNGALRWYDKALQLDATFVDAHFNRGVIYYNAKDYARAEAAFREGLKVAPDDAKLLTGLGRSQLALGERGRAAEALGRAVRLDATNSEAQRALRLALDEAEAEAS